MEACALGSHVRSGEPHCLSALGMGLERLHAVGGLVQGVGQPLETTRLWQTHIHTHTHTYTWILGTRGGRMSNLAKVVVGAHQAVPAHPKDRLALALVASYTHVDLALGL